jgi:hypothetical protein
MRRLRLAEVSFDVGLDFRGQLLSRFRVNDSRVSAYCTAHRHFLSSLLDSTDYYELDPGTKVCFCPLICADRNHARKHSQAMQAMQPLKAD